MTGWRRAGAWGWIAGGLAVFSLAHSLYLYGTAQGTYQAGVVYDAGWPLAALLIAYGAGLPRVRCTARRATAEARSCSRSCSRSPLSGC
jgi:hypothetical protein